MSPEPTAGDPGAAPSTPTQDEEQRPARTISRRGLFKGLGLFAAGGAAGLGVSGAGIQIHRSRRAAARASASATAAVTADPRTVSLTRYERTISGPTVWQMSYPEGGTAPAVYTTAGQKARHRALQAKKASATWTADNPLLVLDPYGTTTSGLYVYFTASSSGTLSFTDSTSAVPDYSAVAANHTATGFEGLVIALVPTSRNTLTLTWTPTSGTRRTIRVVLMAPSNPSGYATQVASEVLDEKSLSPGLFALAGISGLSTNTYLMDNRGAMRAELVTEGAATLNLHLDNGRLITSTGAHQVSAIDPLGHAVTIVDLPDHSLHHDLVVHDNTVVYALASRTGSSRTEDRVLRIDLSSGTATEALDMQRVLPNYEKLSTARGANQDGSVGKDWIHLNAIQIVDGTMYLSSRETSTIIALDDALTTNATPTIRYLIGPEAMWKGTGYEKYLLTASGSPLRNAGQHAVHRIDDAGLADGQYYLEMFNNNYWYVGTRTDIDWRSAGPSSASRNDLSGTSQALRYLVDEKAGTFKQAFSVNVPYSSVVSNVWRLGSDTVADPMVVNSGKAGEYSERAANGTVLASYRYDSTGYGYRVFKKPFDGFWYST